MPALSSQPQANEMETTQSEPSDGAAPGSTMTAGSHFSPTIASGPHDFCIVRLLRLVEWGELT